MFKISYSFRRYIRHLFSKNRNMLETNFMYDASQKDCFTDWTQKNLICHKMYVPSVFLNDSKLCLNEGKIKLNPECHLIFPSEEDKEKDFVIIKAENIESLNETKKILSDKIKKVRESQNPSHFISIPINSEEIASRFESFKESVCEVENEIPWKIFTKTAKKLHLTLSVLFMGDLREKNQAIEMLNDFLISWFSSQQNRKLSFQVEGIDYFGSDPTAAKVVYAKAIPTQEENNVQKFADSIKELFEDNFGIRNKKNSVNLHITLMNTKFLIKDKKFKKKRSYNVAKILEILGDFNFGRFEVERLDICDMVGDSNGYYKCLQTFDLNNLKKIDKD